MHQESPILRGTSSNHRQLLRHGELYPILGLVADNQNFKLETATFLQPLAQYGLLYAPYNNTHCQQASGPLGQCINPTKFPLPFFGLFDHTRLLGDAQHA